MTYLTLKGSISTKKSPQINLLIEKNVDLIRLQSLFYFRKWWEKGWRGTLPDRLISLRLELKTSRVALTRSKLNVTTMDHFFLSVQHNLSTTLM
jgi:hypothetical protein